MKKLHALFFLIILTGSLWSGFPAAASAEAAGNKPFFKFAGRDFTLREARLLAGDSQDIKAAVQLNRPAVASIVLCERAGVYLSPEKTRQNLLDALLLLAPEERGKFDARLREMSLTLEQWLKQQSENVANQLQDACRRWYIKRYGASNLIADGHIRSWYYRHQNIFRRTRIDPAAVWAFDAVDDKLELALASLRQGMSEKSVRDNYAVKVPDEELRTLIQNASARTRIDREYLVINSGKYRLLLKSSALQQTFIPLDKKLSQVIGNVLYDALARARMAEAMQKEFAGEKIVFY